MNFYEKEMRNFFGNSELLQDAHFCGRTCLARLDEDLRVKLQLTTLSLIHIYSLYELVPYGEPSRELSAQALTDEKLEVVEVLGQTALFTNGRVTEQELPDGLYRYDLREGENLAFATIERNVAANHAGTILTKAPLDFGGQEYLVFDEDTSPNFLGYDLTPEEFLQTDFTQTDAPEEDSAPQMGGIQ